MDSLKASDARALQFLLTEDIYHVNGEDVSSVQIPQPAAELPIAPQQVAAEAKPAVEDAKPIEEPAYFDYLGDNNKYILILVNEPRHQHIEPKELETLTNILKGKKQELKDVAIVNLQKYPTATFGALRKFFVCSSVVMFGINPAKIKIDGLKLNRISDFQGSKVLVTYSISEMLSDVDKKRAFWDEMKKL